MLRREKVLSDYSQLSFPSVHSRSSLSLHVYILSFVLSWGLWLLQSWSIISDSAFSFPQILFWKSLWRFLEQGLLLFFCFLFYCQPPVKASFRPHFLSINSQYWRQEEKGTTEDEWLDGITDSMDMGWVDLAVGDGQGGLACCSSWGPKESDTTEQLNWTELTEAPHAWSCCKGGKNTLRLCLPISPWQYSSTS